MLQFGINKYGLPYINHSKILSRFTAARPREWICTLSFSLIKSLLKSDLHGYCTTVFMLSDKHRTLEHCF